MSFCLVAEMGRKKTGNHYLSTDIELIFAALNFYQPDPGSHLFTMAAPGIAFSYNYFVFCVKLFKPVPA
ncbi:MAG TPA: hypothetical protein VEV83_05900 [Parafilimonas sp.]|nr:hypothetical protein [Parafilimonas sp.]